jgi:(4-alkanoyl-5-oxo-2,5-dihydrofuran-3-yl)methyl phosphate reductase
MILITGATGNVGRELVEQLMSKGESLRVVTRDQAKVEHLNPSIERIIGDMSDEAIVEQAVAGVDKIFMFPLITEADHKSNIMLLKKSNEARVKHVVMLSSMGAANEAQSQIGALHREKEILVEKSGMTWTFLRPGAFMSNSLQWLPTIKLQGQVYNPTGAGKVAPISPRDIAAVAAVALTHAGHEGQIYLLTGPELISAEEQVEILSKAIGKSIKCIDVPIKVAAEQMSKTGAPGFLVEGLSAMWEAIKQGNAAIQTKDLERVTSSKGENFTKWCSEHRDEFLN